ncbi:MAG: hypothetical protein PUC65_14075 [Clostridiales bacterium]|nr:hypothetical protein [Clostridiales bacterium]
MSKVGKEIKQATKNVIQASGVATQYTGEAMSKIGKKIGISEEKCNRLEESSEMLGKDIYYASRNAGRKTEQFVDQTIDDTKRLVHRVKNKLK